MNINEVVENARTFLGEGFSVKLRGDVFAECARDGDVFYIFFNDCFIDARSDELMNVAEELVVHLNGLGGGYKARRRYY